MNRKILLLLTACLGTSPLAFGAPGVLTYKKAEDRDLKRFVEKPAANRQGPAAPALPARKGAAKLTLANFRGTLVAKGFVLREDEWHIWCNAPVLDEQGRTQLSFAPWPVKDTFGLGWHTTCEIAHYKADRPEGPDTYARTVLKGSGVEGSWRRDAPHNPTVVRLPDEHYALLFIANSRGAAPDFAASQKIGMMLASSLDGPWRLAGQDGLVLDAPAGGRKGTSTFLFEIRPGK